MLVARLICLFVVAKQVVGQTLNDCSAFTTNGPAASQYQYYRFYDFRNLFTSQPASSSGNRNNSHPQAKVVSSPSWTNDWYIRDYPRKSPGGYSIPVNFTPEEVATTASPSSSNANKYTSFLTLTTHRLDAETQSAGEITFSEFNVSYASIRVYSRVSGAPGGVAGIFTYLNDTEESDIEIFTRAPPTCIQYSNQPSSLGAPTWADIPGATVNVTMPGGRKWTDWHIQRLDWIEGKSVFFVDGIVANETGLHVPVKSPGSGVYVDMWSANSTWSGSMDVGASAQLDVLWIEIMFNTTEGIGDGEGRKTVCTVENGTLVGDGGQKSLGSHDAWLGWILLGVGFGVSLAFV